ncbi:PH domain-containing protein [Herbidospora mongoliensis]|uniref:PH domain-containing protein n=1 Tax=Herbidospora mongoliensis TaxID=688067 RepID=UPI000AED8E8D|nr:PH domain-containing protein [Herbidospora mongoliensis]
MTFRSKTAWFFGWAWLVFVAINTVDLIVRGTLPSALVVGAFLGLVTWMTYFLALRPATITEQGGLRVRNPFRTAYLPWSAIDEVSVTGAITITAGELTVRCWTPMPTARERAKSLRQQDRQVKRGRYPTSEVTLSKGEQAAREAMAGRTHADWVADQIREAATVRKRQSTGEPTVTWAIDSIAATVAMVALAVAAILAL